MKVFEASSAEYQQTRDQLAQISPEMAARFPERVSKSIISPRSRDKEIENGPRPTVESEKPTARRKRMNGMGSVYQPKYRDKKTGEIKPSQRGGSSIHSGVKSDANRRSRRGARTQ